MKKECLECECEITDLSEAMIYSYECTYCVSCSLKQNQICKNCNGELVLRPKRVGSN
ncbi:MAG: DUF1272 domain-containing protein [Kordiimonadaceae bacterium]|nr:DUF1272 domain-containing protein [Kordiimonadaceae bacterium]